MKYIVMANNHEVVFKDVNVHNPYLVNGVSYNSLTAFLKNGNTCVFTLSLARIMTLGYAHIYSDLISEYKKKLQILPLYLVNPTILSRIPSSLLQN